MCGICGTVTKNRISENVIKAMLNTISHRGPDDSGIYIDVLKDNTHVAFAQCRLSIFDLSSAGHQPMISEDGKVIIVYNGEIYNFKELRLELISKGYSFKSDCDTEVILQGYREYGIEVVSKFNGMFAFALLDKHNDTMFLVRDRMGVKPLYYYYDGINLAFASELKPITKTPFFKKEINMEALGKYFACQYIPAPDTIFNNTFKLKQGTILKLKNGSLTEENYWNIPDSFTVRSKEDLGFEYYKNELEKLIEDATVKRMIADVPVGTFLSGGIDSSLITALAQKNRTTPVNTFTIGFKEEKYNEANYAKEVAKVLGTNHYEEYCSIEEAKALIFDTPMFFDEPFADSSQLPTMLVSKIAKKRVTVALSGDAGDELFCGYKNYDDVLIQKKYLILGKIFGSMYPLHKTGNKYLWKAGKILKPQSEKDILTIDSNNTVDITDGLFKKELRKKSENLFDANLYSDSIQENKMLYDMMTYLPDDILVKVDRASMKYALETRNPLLDYRVVENSFSIPHHYKYNNRNKKYILKEILYQYVPKTLIERPKKGFSIPMHEWLHHDLKDQLRDILCKERIKRQGIFDIEQIKRFYKTFEKSDGRIMDDIMWSMLMFQLWYDEYM